MKIVEIKYLLAQLMFNTHYLEKKNKTEANNSTWCSTTFQGNNSKAHTVLLLMSEAKKTHF